MNGRLGSAWLGVYVVVEFGTVKVHSCHKALMSIAKGQCGTVDVHSASTIVRWTMYCDDVFFVQ